MLYQQAEDVDSKACRRQTRFQILNDSYALTCCVTTLYNYYYHYTEASDNTLKIPSEKNHLPTSIPFGTKIGNFKMLQKCPKSEVHLHLKLVSQRNMMLYATESCCCSMIKTSFSTLNNNKRYIYPVQDISSMSPDKALIQPNLLQSKYWVSTQTTELLILSKYR